MQISEHPLVTIAFVYRERISQTIECLEHLIANTDYPYRLICVDSGAPQNISEELKKLSVKHSFTLLRSDQQLTPNESRNLALELVDTPYVVFIDNDVIVSKNWLEPLVKCAQETGAWLVGPLYLESFRGKTRIHMAGGEVCNRDANGQPSYYEKHHLQKIDLDNQQLTRTKTDLIEFHTVLMDMEAFRQLGVLDPLLMSLSEHGDISLLVTAAGKEIYIEPKSVITYMIPESLNPIDREFFSLRWSVAWNEASSIRLSQKYGIPFNDEGLQNCKNFVDHHRQRVLIKYPKFSGLFSNQINRVVHGLGRRLEKLYSLRKFPVKKYAKNRQVKANIV